MSTGRSPRKGAKADDAGESRSVADDSQILCALIPKGADQVLRSSSRACKAVYHERSPVGNVRYGFGKRGHYLFDRHRAFRREQTGRSGGTATTRHVL